MSDFKGQKGSQGIGWRPPIIPTKRVPNINDRHKWGFTGDKVIEEGGIVYPKFDGWETEKKFNIRLGKFLIDEYGENNREDIEKWFNHPQIKEYYASLIDFIHVDPFEAITLAKNAAMPTASANGGRRKKSRRRRRKTRKSRKTKKTKKRR